MIIVSTPEGLREKLAAVSLASRQDATAARESKIYCPSKKAPLGFRSGAFVGNSSSLD
jgi:hypothetical protein